LTVSEPGHTVCRVRAAITGLPADHANVLADEALGERLAALGAALRASGMLWRAAAFRALTLPWEAEHPGLSRALRALPLAQAEQLHADANAAREWLGRWLPVAEWQALAQVGAWPARSLPDWPARFECEVPGRKWAQVEAFAAAVADSGLSGVDWCAGKGHLARALSQQWGGREIDALERDAALCAEGTRLAARARLPVAMRRCDVLDESVQPWLGARRHALSLHACGELHRRLLQLAAQAGVAAISCAPCCYHLGSRVEAIACSATGRLHEPGLRCEDLRTAVQETVTAPGHARRQRRRVQQWQLGFDLLQRELRGVDAYLPLPALRAAELADGFETWCRSLAAREGIALPAGVDLARFERAGAARFATVTALDLVRHCFRRPIELWLVLDRALYLCERGYRVGVGTFCSRAVSPRNLLIDARRAPG